MATLPRDSVTPYSMTPSHAKSVVHDKVKLVVAMFDCITGEVKHNADAGIKSTGPRGSNW